MRTPANRQNKPYRYAESPCINPDDFITLRTQITPTFPTIANHSHHFLPTTVYSQYHSNTYSLLEACL